MPHLTEDQIDELLMGSLDVGEAAQLREHANECETCAAQLAELEAPIASFKAVSLAWSERRSATMPVRPTARRAPRGMGFAWGAGAAAVLLAAVIPVLRHEQNVRVEQARNATRIQGAVQTAVTTPPATATSANSIDDSAATAVPENTQEIASDNLMLAMVDAELNAPLPSPGSTIRGHSRSSTPGTVQD